MDRERWQQIGGLLSSALQLEPDRRKAFLETACAGDEELRREVEALLHAHHLAEGFLEQPLLEKPDLDPTSDQKTDSLIGLTILHYRIVEKIGEGGMGVVYRARDEHLKCDVAVKVLPPELVVDLERKKRFVQEARAASALSHPNIVTIYDIASEGGREFIAMEYVAGKTLHRIVPRKGMRLSEALKIAVQIAGGLAKAHAAGIVHRDLKPANITVTGDGLVKLLDFCVAKLTEPAQGRSATSTWTTKPNTEAGAILRTVGYMAPEQIRSQAVDHRADIFSFGCVLYEMLSGRRAFQGETPADTMSAILSKDPPPLSGSGREVPAVVQGILSRCLEKRPEDRFSSAHDLALALEAVSGVGPLVPAPMAGVGKKPRIVVLPLENNSPEPDTEYYADGITTEITEKLSKVGALTVLSYRTALALKGTPKPVSVIAKELNLRYVLEGRIRWAGNSLRINARLIDGTSEAILWSGQFPGTLDDVFDMQEKVGRGIVDGLELKLTSAEDRGVTRRPITNAQAYDCYLRARNALIRHTPEGVNAALQLLQKGRELSEDNALLDAGLGYAYFQLGNLGIQQDEAYTKAEMYAEQALRIDPNNVDTLFGLSESYSFVGRTSAAMACADRLMQINPFDVTPYAARWWAHFFSGRFDLSAESERQLVGLLDVPLGRACLAYALAAAWRFEAASTE